MMGTKRHEKQATKHDFYLLLFCDIKFDMFKGNIYNNEKTLMHFSDRTSQKNKDRKLFMRKKNESGSVFIST